jgi:hypothetical protein
VSVVAAASELEDFVHGEVARDVVAKAQDLIPSQN